MSSRSPPSGRSDRMSLFYLRASESKLDDLGPLCPILPTLLSCVKHTRHRVFERDSHSHQNPPRWFVCSSPIHPSVHPSIFATYLLSKSVRSLTLFSFYVSA